MEINLDFDGTCVTHTFPEVGEEIGAIPVLKKLVDNGHRLILFTMRSEEHLVNAIKWFYDNNIPLYGIQTNPTQKQWTSSPKSYAPIMIDDSALGCPLKQKVLTVNNETFSCKLEEVPINDVKEYIGIPYVDWEQVEKLLTEKGLFKND